MAYDGMGGMMARQRKNSNLLARVKRVRKQFHKMEREKTNWLNYWQTIAELMYPERANFILKRTAGVEQHDGLYSSTGIQMRRDFGNKIGAMMRPRANDWFKVTAKPEELNDLDNVRFWCEDTTKGMRDIIYARKANFARAMQESDQDYGAFGNSVVYHAYNREGTGLTFRCCNLRDVSWRIDEEGQVCEVHEKLTLSLGVLAKMFGAEALPREWRRELEDKKDNGNFSSKTIVRAVCRVGEYEYSPGEYPNPDHEWASIYFAIGCDDEEGDLGEEYYFTNPYTVRRWMSVSDETYARSPCSAAFICDARTLNTTEAALLKGIEWKVAPPRWAVQSAVVGEFALRSDGVTMVDAEAMANSKEPFGTMDSGDPSYGMDYLHYKEIQGRQAWFDHILKIPERGSMTATEIVERIEMYTQEAAPIFEPMEADNAHICDAVFDRAMRKGAFYDVPEELQNADIDYVFETPLSLAREKKRAQEYQAMIEQTTIAMQVNPAAGDHIDWDAAERDALGGIVSQKWIKTKEDVAAAREQRAQAQEEEQAKSEAMDAAEIAGRANPENVRQLMEGQEA